MTHRQTWMQRHLPPTHPYTLRFDGSCRPNPGPMGVGYVLSDEAGAPIVRVGQQIGQGTNNQAEYQALLWGLRHALRLGMWSLTVEADSNLLVRQIMGDYKVRDGVLKRLHREAGMLLDLFAGPVTIRHIYREENGGADELSRVLLHEGPVLPPPSPKRAILDWQAAAVNVWWHSHGVRSAAILSKIFDIQDVQIDQIVSGKSYANATFVGLPTYALVEPAWDSGPYPPLA